MKTIPICFGKDPGSWRKRYASRATHALFAVEPESHDSTNGQSGNVLFFLASRLTSFGDGPLSLALMSCGRKSQPDTLFAKTRRGEPVGTGAPILMTSFFGYCRAEDGILPVDPDQRLSQGRGPKRHRFRRPVAEDIRLAIAIMPSLPLQEAVLSDLRHEAGQQRTPANHRPGGIRAEPTVPSHPARPALLVQKRGIAVSVHEKENIFRLESGKFCLS